MDATVSAVLHEIATNLRPLETLQQSSLPEQLLVTFITAVLSFISAIMVALKIEDIKRNREKSNLVPGKIIRTRQGATIHFRLPLKNQSNYIARKVEVDVEKIIDDDGHEREIVPTPLDWTHGEELRDIFPNQTALLNICEVQQEQGKFIKVRAVRIMHLDEMVVVKKGTTKVILKYYQENGQTGKIRLKIVWNGNKTFNKRDLPTITVF